MHLVFPPTLDSEPDDEDFEVVHSPLAPEKEKPPRVEKLELTARKPDPRRSRFVYPAGDGEADATQAKRVVTVHYVGAGTHEFESETFKGLTFTCRRITTIPEE